ncbi:LuxR C-terminal-related transcriptional regulator, partial [Nodosilinea sp. P-1105]|uniref:helix-turn-helix domain-containing protein n=1 Tax=Nodosilinea sp. P-1105 TaxID=2546229 RepID=UPI00146E0B39
TLFSARFLCSIPDAASSLGTLSPVKVHGSFISSGDAPLLSSREQQVMQLLAEGKRDRDIAQALYISESTVKFHINNSLAKLKAKNRYQGVYQATLRGWI